MQTLAIVEGGNLDFFHLQMSRNAKDAVCQTTIAPVPQLLKFLSQRSPPIASARLTAAGACSGSST